MSGLNYVDMLSIVLTSSFGEGVYLIMVTMNGTFSNASFSQFILTHLHSVAEDIAKRSVAC